tara:strand:- start:596 stop:787 length:192 start_codon:yes stop_codon:yes gene_type:complete
MWFAQSTVVARKNKRFTGKIVSTCHRITTQIKVESVPDCRRFVLIPKPVSMQQHFTLLFAVVP